MCIPACTWAGECGQGGVNEVCVCRQDALDRKGVCGQGV